MPRSSKIDLIGKKFEMLTVIEYSHSNKLRAFWKVRCDCGTEKTVSRSYIRKAKSCGCQMKTHFHDITGQAFNGNKAIRYVDKNKFNCFRWEFECKCGKSFISEGNDIVSGKIISCGCRWNSEQIINADYEKTAKNTIYADYKTKAAQRFYEFNLTKDVFNKLIKSNCHYCNIEPFNVYKYKKYTFKYNGIDRIKNDEGYNENNVVTACKICNQAKHQMTSEYFKEWLEKVFTAKSNKTGFWK